MLLQGPVQPKPPSFFEQAYQGKEDYRKVARAKSANRPYSAYHNNDTASYMSHHKLKQIESNSKKTIDVHNHTHSRKQKQKAKAKPKVDDEDEWERFNEQVSYKSGVSRKSNRSQASRFSQRLRSAIGSNRKNGEEVKNAYAQQPPVLTHKNLKDFEERLSSQAASIKNYKAEGQIDTKEQLDANGEHLPEDPNAEHAEGEGDEVKEDGENPNEPNQENADGHNAE